MKHYIECDAHKKYSVFARISEAGELMPAKRVEHDRESYRAFLKGLPAGSHIAVESVGNWYWMVYEMEKAGHVPALVHPGKAKLMMGQISKTDKLDAQGLAILAPPSTNQTSTTVRHIHATTDLMRLLCRTLTECYLPCQYL